MQLCVTCWPSLLTSLPFLSPPLQTPAPLLPSVLAPAYLHPLPACLPACLLSQLKAEYPDRVLIASIMEEYSRPAWEELVERCQEAGVDAFEINFRWGRASGARLAAVRMKFSG